MGSDLVVIAGVGFEDATQIRFAEHQDVVEAFAPDRANEPDGMDRSLLITASMGQGGRLDHQQSK